MENVERLRRAPRAVQPHGGVRVERLDPEGTRSGSCPDLVRDGMVVRHDAFTEHEEALRRASG